MKDLINRHGFVLPKHTLFGSIRFPSLYACSVSSDLYGVFSGIRNVFIPGNLTQPGFDAAFSLKMLYSFSALKMSPV